MKNPRGEWQDYDDGPLEHGHDGWVLEDYEYVPHPSSKGRVWPGTAHLTYERIRRDDSVETAAVVREE